MSKDLHASQKCKQHGINLNELVELTGEARRSLQHWSKHRPNRFRLMILGALESRRLENENN